MQFELAAFLCNSKIEHSVTVAIHRFMIVASDARAVDSDVFLRAKFHACQSCHLSFTNARFG